MDQTIRTAARRLGQRCVVWVEVRRSRSKRGHAGKANKNWHWGNWIVRVHPSAFKIGYLESREKERGSDSELELKLQCCTCHEFSMSTATDMNVDSARPCQLAAILNQVMNEDVCPT
jgi:hypothetical protein